MCTDCVPPLTRRWEVRPAGTGLAILTEEEPHGINLSLKALSAGFAEFVRQTSPTESVTYFVYAKKDLNRAAREEALKTLSRLQYEALARLGRSLMNPLQEHPEPVSFFFYGDLRVIVAKAGADAIELATIMPINETSLLTPEKARRLIDHPGTCRKHAQLALLAECIWKALGPSTAQPVLALAG